MKALWPHGHWLGAAMGAKAETDLKRSGWRSAGFMPNASGRVMPYGIVGQLGLFEFFKVIFDRVGEEIELRNKMTGK